MRNFPSLDHDHRSSGSEHIHAVQEDTKILMKGTICTSVPYGPFITVISKRKQYLYRSRSESLKPIELSILFTLLGGRDTRGSMMDQLNGTMKWEGPQCANQEWKFGNKNLRVSLKCMVSVFHICLSTRYHAFMVHLFVLLEDIPLVRHTHLPKGKYIASPSPLIHLSQVLFAGIVMMVYTR